VAAGKEALVLDVNRQAGGLLARSRKRLSNLAFEAQLHEKSFC
jgi:hypothetical protein